MMPPKLSLKPTPNGGRRIEFDTPRGVGHAEWDAEGNLVSQSVEIREPQTQTRRGLLPPASDAEADPANETPGKRGCCDPPQANIQ